MPPARVRLVSAPDGKLGHVPSDTSATGVLCGSTTKAMWVSVPTRRKIALCPRCAAFTKLPPMGELVTRVQHDGRHAVARAHGIHEDTLRAYLARHRQPVGKASHPGTSPTGRPEFPPPTGIPVAYLPGAACARHPNPEVFMADDRVSQEEALRVCARCPEKTRDECLEWSLEYGEHWGTWGGMTEQDRARLRRLRRRGVG